MEYNNPHQMGGQQEFYSYLNSICNFLNFGFAFHKRLANQNRKFAVRGWGRVHDRQTHHDADKLICFEKILCDKLGWCPTYDYAKLSEVNSIKINSMESFKQHHVIWKQHEKSIVPTLNKAIHEARTVDIEIYQFLICLLDKVQKEIMRIDMICGSLEFAGWNTHDVSVKSKWLHEQEEKGEITHDVNANIG